MLAEVGLVGRALNRYSLYIGGNRVGTRIPTQYLETKTESDIMAALDPLVGDWARHRQEGECFGDFAVRRALAAKVLTA